jgi:hypothetical protein
VTEVDVLEVFSSPYINPTAIVRKEGKVSSSYIDASRMSSVTMPGERTPAIHKLLQRFHGANQMTTLGLALDNGASDFVLYYVNVLVLHLNSSQNTESLLKETV